MSEGTQSGIEQAIFAEVIVKLTPYLDELILAGGWAHRLYLLHRHASPAMFEPLMTEDADFAIRARLAARATPINVLLGELGFAEKLGGDSTPPVTKYVRGRFEVEFITSLQGSEYKGEKRDVTVGSAGVTAQKLRYVEVLAVRPWTVHLSEEHGYPVGPTPLAVRIPNPACFIAQKLLALQYRNQFVKKVKDVLYVHDTIAQFRDSLPALREEWGAASAELPESVHKKLRKQCAAVFAPTSLCLAPAAAIARSTGRPGTLTATALGNTCRDGLRAIFELT